MRLVINIAVVIVTASFAAGTLRWWLNTPCIMPIERRVPADRPEEAAFVTLDPTDHCNRLTTTFERHAEHPAESPTPQIWPVFRGNAARQNTAEADVALAERWPAGGPPVLWQVEVGDGHAGAAIYEGAVYLLDYDETARRDVLRCLSLADGREIWRRSYEVTIKRNHGVSRTVPAVSEDYVVTMGPKCHVMCVDRRSGDLNWGLDLVRDYGTTVPLWYTGQCPLIDDGLAILAPGGRDLLMAIDCDNGDVVWRTPNPDGWEMSHSSVVSMTFGGQRAFVYAALGGIVAVAAEGTDRGSVLWKTDLWAHRIVAPCPVQIADDYLFMTSGHGAGGMLLKLARENDAWRVTEGIPVEKTVFAAEQQTPILRNGLLYAVLPKDAGSHREELVCYDPKRRQVLWRSGRELRFGLGPTIVIGDRLLAMDDRATLRMFRLEQNQPALLASTLVLEEARDAWGPPAFAGGLLLVRDSTRLVCLDLRASSMN